MEVNNIVGTVVTSYKKEANKNKIVMLVFEKGANT